MVAAMVVVAVSSVAKVALIATAVTLISGVSAAPFKHVGAASAGGLEGTC